MENLKYKVSNYKTWNVLVWKLYYLKGKFTKKKINDLVKILLKNEVESVMNNIKNINVKLFRCVCYKTVQWYYILVCNTRKFYRIKKYWTFIQS